MKTLCEPFRTVVGTFQEHQNQKSSKLFKCEIKPSPRSWNQAGIKFEAKVLIMVELVGHQIVCQANLT